MVFLLVVGSFVGGSLNCFLKATCQMPLYIHGYCLYMPCLKRVISTNSGKICSSSMFGYSTGIPIGVSWLDAKSAEFGVYWYFLLLEFHLKCFINRSLDLSVSRVMI